MFFPCPQCVNGHLMCAGCFTHVLADARLKDEQSTCPNCRCEIGKTLCSRNLAVEKTVSELPSLCEHCSCKLPRNVLEHHQRSDCPQRYDLALLQRAAVTHQYRMHASSVGCRDSRLNRNVYYYPLLSVPQ